MDNEIVWQLQFDHKLHTEICQFVAQRSQNEEVKQFAQTVHQGHSEMIAKFDQPGQSTGPARYDVSSTLREIAQRLESRAGSRREMLGFRGPAAAGASAQPGQAAAEPSQPVQPRSDIEKRREELRKIIDQQRAAIQNTRQENREDREDRREARGERGAGDDDRDRGNVASREAWQKLQEARRELRELRQDSRDRARDRFARALPRLWTRAPEILNAVAETVDEMGSKMSQGPFGDYERKVAERLATTIKKELEQKTGKDFDRAYLGYEVFSHLKTLDTMEVAKEYCSPEVCATLNESISMAQTHLQQARDLMQKLDKEGT